MWVRWVSDLVPDRWRWMCVHFVLCLLHAQGVVDRGCLGCIYGCSNDILFPKSSPYPVSLSLLGDFLNRIFVEFECLSLAFIFLDRTDYVIYLFIVN